MTFAHYQHSKVSKAIDMVMESATRSRFMSFNSIEEIETNCSEK